MIEYQANGEAEENGIADMEQSSDKTLKCLHCCKKGSRTYHEIFDDVGIELQLDMLLEQHFQLKIVHVPLENQVLCDECVTELIRLYDLSERLKEQKPSGSDRSPKATKKAKDKGAGVVIFEFTVADEKSISPTSTRYIEGTEIPAEELSDSDNVERSEIIFDCEEFDGDDDLTNGMNTESDCEETNKEDGDGMAFEIIVEYNNEIDEMDLQEFADAAINTNLEELQLERRSICRICSKELETHQDLLSHIINDHYNGESYTCVVDDCKEVCNSLRILARHIVLRHYDLRNIAIFGACPYCSLPFSNFLYFNKHSCCRSIKFHGRSENLCTECKMVFPSFKRYRFHMQFHMTKRRPKVCLLCDKFFADGEEFFEHVHYSHEPKDRLICVQCDRSCKNKELFEAHMRKHNLTPKHKCKCCSRVFVDQYKLRSHMVAAHKDEDQYQCDICNKVLLTKVNFRYHMKYHELGAEVHIHFCARCGLIDRDAKDLQKHVESKESRCYRAAINQEFVSMAYVCEYCEALFRTQAELKGHRNSGVHDDKVFHCPLCATTFEQLRKLRAHFKSHKVFEDWRNSLPLHRMYMCDVGDCEHSYATWVTLQCHKATKHREMQPMCNKCNMNFASESELEKHLSDCKRDSTHKCPFCDKVCPTKMSLSVHIARSHNNKNIKCSSCLGSFKDEDALQKHFNFEHVQVECAFCKKKVKNQRNLVLHERVKHSNIKRYFCHVCEKGFYNKSDMKIHEKLAHSGVIYQCEKCTFTTNYKNSMDVHMAKHNNDFQFQCDICLRQFTRKSCLDIHVKRHISDREFLCSEYVEGGCSASYVSRNQLTRHIKQKHSNLDAEAANAPHPRKRSKRNNIEEKLQQTDDKAYDDSTLDYANFQSYIECDDLIEQEDS